MTETIVHPFRQGSAERVTFGYKTEDHPQLDRVQNGISAVCGVIAGVSIVSIAVLTLIDVASRTLFSAPLGWTVAFIEQYLLTAGAFFGIVTAYRSGAHVAVVSIFNTLQPTARKVLLVTAYVITFAGMLALAFTGLSATLFSISTGESPVPGSSELVIPSWIWRSIVPTSMFLGAAVVAIDLGRELFSPWSRTTTDYDPGHGTDLPIEVPPAPVTSISEDPR